MSEMTDRSRVLLIRTELESRDAVALCVEDTGPGIQPEQLNDIFAAVVTTKP
jgi:C4-dicarboxylate-specific signal transduction histidine kinase